MIRLSDAPTQAFDCEGGRLTAGTQIAVYQAHGGDGQRFKVNPDLTALAQPVFGIAVTTPTAPKPTCAGSSDSLVRDPE